MLQSFLSAVGWKYMEEFRAEIMKRGYLRQKLTVVGLMRFLFPSWRYMTND